MYSWERVRVRVILFSESHSTSEITLTPTLSHEYVGEGVRASFPRGRFDLEDERISRGLRFR